jgi:hypothetical protein
MGKRLKDGYLTKTQKMFTPKKQPVKPVLGIPFFL